MTDAPSLPLTGERTVPGVPDETYWFERHVVAYELAARHVAGATDGPPWYCWESLSTTSGSWSAS